MSKVKRYTTCVPSSTKIDKSHFDKKSIYHYILTIFKLLLIFPLSSSSRKNTKNKIRYYVLRFVNIFVMLYFGLFTILKFLIDTHFSLIISSIMIDIILFIFRLAVSLKWKKLCNIVQKINLMETVKDITLNNWIYYYGIASYVIAVFGIMYHIISGGEDIDPLVWYMKTYAESYLLPKVILTILSSMVRLCCFMLVITFGVFYVIICNHIWSAIASINQRIAYQQSYDIESSLSQYLSLKSFAESIDDWLSFLVFCITILTSAVDYFLLILISRFSWNANLAVLACFCLNYTVTFIAMSASATRVAEVSTEFVKLVKRKLKMDGAILNSRRDVTFVGSELEIHFTVWKIVCINRSFILSTTGTIITYVMLFNSMENFEYISPTSYITQK